MTNQPEQYYDVVDVPSFLARSKKAIAGGITGLAAGGAGAAVSAALADGAVEGAEIWQIVALALGGFLVGFGGVYLAPKNATPTPVEGNGNF